MLPKISYIICTTPRSGSNFFCDLLESTKVAGSPREHFLSKWRERLAHRYFESSDAVTVSLERYLTRVVEATATDNGVFAAKIMAVHFFNLLNGLRGLPAYRGMSDMETLRTVFPGVKFIWLTRRDKVRQAISLANAYESKVWKSTQLPPGETYAEATITLQEIDDLVRALVNYESRWQEFFKTFGVEPLTLVYEDIDQNYGAAVRLVLDYLSIAMPSEWKAENVDTVKKITRPDADKWRAEYLAYTAGLDRTSAKGTPAVHGSTSPSVALCTLVNEDYLVGLVALLKSLRQSNPHINVPFLIYTIGALSPSARQRIEQEYPFIKYVGIDGSLYTKCKFSNYRPWGMNPAFRYELFRNCDYDQLVYIDTDTLVVGNIDPLLQFRGALGACAFPPGEGMELTSTGGFNAGVMSIGREIRNPEIWKQLISVAEGRAWSGNQTVLNLVLKPFLQPLPEIYNMRTAVLTPERLAAARIVHFVGFNKPWEKDPFDNYQRGRAGQEMCDALLALWNKYAPTD